MLEFRKNHTHVSSSFLFRQWATWGSLHASIGPECGEDFEDRFWAWSVNATDASASIASLAARRPATAAAGCRDDPSFEGPWKGASCEAWAGWVRAQRFRCEDYREQAPLLLRSCPVACGTCEAGEGAEPKVGKGRASAGDVGPEAKAGKGRAPPAAAAATGAEAAASRGPAAQSAGKGRPQAEAPSPPPPTVVYFLKQSGVCEKHVETESECEEAAESLSEVRASRIEFSFSRVDRPVGCYWYKHSDTLNWNTNIAGVDCNKQRQCICKEDGGGQRAEAHVEAESEEAKQERLQALRAQLSGSGGILGEDGGGSARRKGGGSKTIIMGDASSQSHIEYREVDDDGGMTSLNPHGR
ncbi:unnamed protein product [Prorocentrum cordatum]|uniref:ShKT domain-containing protein n=1 Tax=Prorocentrum cordatum TaxID=2364126 RepID=A0ABN9SWZ3_9DINO|nr:unnamed protein product [Polarella glacialis]